MVSHILPFHRGRGLASLSSIIVMVAFIYILGIQTSKYDLPLVNLTTEQWNNSHFFFLKANQSSVGFVGQMVTPNAQIPLIILHFPLPIVEQKNLGSIYQDLNLQCAEKCDKKVRDSLPTLTCCLK